MTDVVPKLVGGVGEINFGKQYRQGNRVYDGNSIAMCLNAQPVGNAGGYSYLYAIDETKLSEKESDNLTDLNKRYDADEQADFTQTEAEEWATEIALRIQEGNLDPIPSNKIKQSEQYDFTYVSLFSGIGGFEQALNKLGGTCVLASEIDKFANQAYETLYGHSTVGDITKVKAEDVPDHDVLVGGFPCQAFSVAGKRGGFNDIRGTLFFEMARIAKEKQPKIFLAENVKGLLSHDKGRTMDTIVTTLSDIGYRVDFEVLNSKYFGVPQNRERVFLIGIREDLLENEAWDIPKGSTVVPKAKRRLAEYEDLKTFNFDWPAQEDVLTRLKDVLEADVDEKYYLSEEKTAKLVSQLTDNESDSIVQIGNIDQHKRKRNNPQTGRVYATSGVSPTLSTMQGGGLEPKIAEEQAEIEIVGNLKPEGSTRHGQRDNVYSDNGLMGALNASDYKQPRPIAQEVRPVLTPDRTGKRQNGRRFKEDGEESSTLTSQDKHGIAIGNPPKYRIRKLTPLECWRLQGFTDEAHEAVKEAGISDSQRYKMAGNAVTVNVIDAIGRKLLPYL